jgi:hypothetical protein
VNENAEIPEKSEDNKPSAIEELEEIKVLLKNKLATKVLGVESQKIKKILEIIEQYMTIVDVAIQHHPDITALVWAGIRFMIQVWILDYLAAINYTQCSMPTDLCRLGFQYR